MIGQEEYLRGWYEKTEVNLRVIKRKDNSLYYVQIKSRDTKLWQNLYVKRNMEFASQDLESALEFMRKQAHDIQYPNGEFEIISSIMFHNNN